MSLFLNGYEVNCPLWRLTQRPLLWLQQPLPPGRKYQAYICYNKYRLLSVLGELLPLNLGVVWDLCSLLIKDTPTSASSWSMWWVFPPTNTWLAFSAPSAHMECLSSRQTRLVYLVKCSARHFRTEHTVYLEWNILRRMMQHSPLALREPF